MIVANNMNDIFYKMYHEINLYGHKKHGTTELNNAIFELTNPNNNVVSCWNKIDYGYMCAEELWYVLRDEKLEFINKFNAPGFKRTSEDGIYSNSAYGDIVFVRHGYNQLLQVIDILSTDPDSRRAVINLNVPNRHRKTCMDEICTFNLSFYINDGKLYCTAMMRSNDFSGCMPYDVLFFTNLQRYIAWKLNVQLGSYTHFATSLHIYEKDNLWNFVFDKNDLEKKYPKYRFDFFTTYSSRISLIHWFNEYIENLDETEKKTCNYNEIILNLFKKYNLISEVE